MSDRVIIQQSDDEIRRIERSLAYTAASGDLNLEFNYAKRDGEPVYHWLDLEDYERGDAPQIEDALTYLEHRGLLERDPAHPTWISIREESEATA